MVLLFIADPPVTKIGNILGYKNTKKITGGQIDKNGRDLYLLKHWSTNKNCKNIIAKIFTGTRLSSSERKFKFEKCYEQYKHNNVLKISCDEPLTQTSMIGQSVCSSSGNCPTGFSPNDKNEEESPCLPNRCTCDNGIAAHSNYASMDYICGLRSNEDSFDDEDDDDYDDTTVVNRKRRSMLRIYNGQKIEAVEWPFFVKIYQKMPNGQNPSCGGAILHPLYVITAAHCVFIKIAEKYTRLNKVWVHAGRNDFNEVPEQDEQYDGQAEYNIPNMFVSSNIIVHNDFKEEGLFFNDVSLIELNRVIHFSDEVRPICLYSGTTEELFSDDTDPDKVKLIVAGYGGTSDFNQADFMLQHHKDCTLDNFESDRFHQQDLDTILCGRGQAADSENNNEIPNTCSGDSGSPLMVKTLELVSGKILTKWKLVGIVSMGPKNCTSENSETLFANVHNQNYANWIEKTIQNNTETGTYCYQDNSSQCVKCDKSYKLTNQVCELEFSQNQMSSVYGFFNTTFCADDCTSYMKITPDNSCTESSQTSIEYNKCTCKNGKPALRCDAEDKDYCDPDGCYKHYHYDPKSKKCKRNECYCDSLEEGNAGPAKNCDVHNTQQCDCEKYYHNDEWGNCVENVCRCNEPDSIPVPNNQCKQHDTHQCYNCPKFNHYDKASETCMENICQCPYGRPVQFCSIHNGISCKLDTCKKTEEIEYVQVDTSIGRMNCVHPCRNNTRLDNHWFSPNEDYTKHWLVVNAIDNGGKDFTEAMDFCKTKGSYVSLPSSLDNLELLTSKISTPTWLGLKNNSKNIIWKRFGTIFTSFNEYEFIPGDSGHNCIQVREDVKIQIDTKFID